MGRKNSRFFRTKFPEFTLATLPDVLQWKGAIVIVTDSPQPTIYWSDGTTWIDVNGDPVSGTVAYTMDAAGGGDFTDFDELFDWLRSTRFEGAIVDVNVAVGEYSITKGTVIGPYPGLRELTIDGDSEAGCVINAIGLTSGVLMYASRTKMRLQGFTIDNGAIENGSFMYPDSCDIDFYSITLNGFERFVNATGGYTVINGCTLICNGDHNDPVIQGQYGASMYISGCTIETNDIGIYLMYNSHAKIYNNSFDGNDKIPYTMLAAMSMYSQTRSTINADTNTFAAQVQSNYGGFVVGEIGYNGSYVAHVSVPMSFKA